MKARIARIGEADGRNFRRRSVNFAACVRMNDELGGVAILNLSQAGCSFAPTGGLSEGDVFWLKLPDLEARICEIRWTKDSTAGCEFAQPLSEATVANLLAPGRKVTPTATRGTFGRGLSR
jgi:hypothetical protein